MNQYLPPPFTKKEIDARRAHGETIICRCGKGYACTTEGEPMYGQCTPCFKERSTCRELKLLGMKR